MQLRIEKKKIDDIDWLKVKVAGEIDMAVADEFRDKLTAALKEGQIRNLLLDFTALDFIDSSGLGVILGRLRQLEPQGGRITIMGCNPQIYRMLKASGLHKVIEVELPRPGSDTAEMGK